MGITAGILLVLMSVAHNLFGEMRQRPALERITKDDVIIGSQRIMVFQGGFLLLAVGIIQIMVSADLIVLTGIARYFPIGIVFINFFTALIITALFHRTIFRITIPQFAVFLLIMLLQYTSL